MGSGFTLLSDPPRVWLLAANGGYRSLRCAVERGRVDDRTDVSRAAAEAGKGPVFLPTRIRNTDGYVNAGWIWQSRNPRRHDIFHVSSFGRCLHLSFVCSRKSLRGGKSWPAFGA